MGRTALVTGCSSGIGRATADAFLADGWRVFATTREPATVHPFEHEAATVLALDVTSQAAVERVVSDAGRLDCLVNNAGTGSSARSRTSPPTRCVSSSRSTSSAPTP
jgi:NAD(P)-dependent dehydrogenase (short-subunit alcohol dehydrogenase family)